MARKNDILKPKEALADREKMWSEIPNLPPKCRPDENCLVQI